jgi:RNA polymerase sigma-70 factor (ECF subfamily)
MEKKPPSAKPRVFSTTHWSVVLAVQDANPAQAAQALETLCQAYWHPLYSYLRRRGSSPPDAEDLIQGFFEELLELHALDKADPERGRFRAFLIACLKKFVARQHQWAGREKRGGGQATLSLDIPDAEQRYGDLLAADDDTPDQIYERQWAATLLRTVLDVLRAEAVARGQGDLFDHLQSTLTGERPSTPLRRPGGALEPRRERGQDGGAPAARAVRRAVPRGNHPDRGLPRGGGRGNRAPVPSA